MDIGVWMSPEILEEKLSQRDERNPEVAWNLTRWPRGFSAGSDNRLFVASENAWRGYFRLSAEALFNPDDPSAAYTLLFDTRSWTLIPPTPVRRFRGFTYKVPGTKEAAAEAAADSAPPPVADPPSSTSKEAPAPSPHTLRRS